MNDVKKRWAEYGNVFLLCISAVSLIALQQQIGWLVLLIGLITLSLTRRPFIKDFMLLYCCLIILGFTPISTNISYLHLLVMGAGLGLALITPYGISRFLYKDSYRWFHFHHKRKWYKNEILYIFLTAFLSYILLPWMLRTTGSYRNWTVEPGLLKMTVLFIGTQTVGLWEEMFFICTTLGIIQKHFPFRQANVFQAVIMTSFLFALGFRSYTILFIFIFSFLQGYAYKKTQSLFFGITSHLLISLILYLALIHSYFPSKLPIFFN